MATPNLSKDSYPSMESVLSKDKEFPSSPEEIWIFSKIIFLSGGTKGKRKYNKVQGQKTKSCEVMHFLS